MCPSTTGFKSAANSSQSLKIPVVIIKYQIFSLLKKKKEYQKASTVGVTKRYFSNRIIPCINKSKTKFVS